MHRMLKMCSEWNVAANEMCAILLCCMQCSGAAGALSVSEGML